MKLVCTTENLKSAVMTAERFTSRHITLPILSHILCRADERKIVIIATNLEIAVEYTLTGKVQKSGTVTIAAKPITQLLHSIRDDTVSLEAKSHELTLRTPTVDATLLGLDPAEFPTLPSFKREHSSSVMASALAQALGQVVPAASTSEFKPELAGVLFSIRGDALTLAATDSFRLAEKSISGHEKSGDQVECIVPLRTAQELARLLPSESGENIRINIGEHQVVFEWGALRILSRLIDGAYPPYQNIIPSSYESTLLVNREDLVKSIRLAAVFSSRLNDVTLRFSPTELEVASANAETGNTKARLAVKGRGASGMSVFNYRYLSDGLEAASGEHILLSLNGVAGPTLITNPADNSFRYLVMPIRSV